MERHRQPASQHLPAVDLLGPQAQPLYELVPLARGQEGQRLGRTPAEPGGQHVRVGVVPQSLIESVRVAVVVLVRAHHPGNVETAVERVVGGEV